MAKGMLSWGCLVVLLLAVERLDAQSSKEEGVTIRWLKCFCPKYAPYFSVCPSEYHCKGIQCDCTTCGCGLSKRIVAPWPSRQNQFYKAPHNDVFSMAYSNERRYPPFSPNMAPAPNYQTPGAINPPTYYKYLLYLHRYFGTYNTKVARQLRRRRAADDVMQRLAGKQ
ncbi:uncharacterized protein LOC106161355 [Lingula anatina]|uniref:Uncharacterized protein LOC106161355 n=1 Tax=Lingula anatina TaxID=7574 RepID=A0A1S3I665_LINAN|nr:uncharacterized protein LOC106161355 [Lingula anatina]|eukprot:XP_013393747.1 uncharacterized protein LOC106161355 [Lingula anatina]